MAAILPIKRGYIWVALTSFVVVGAVLWVQARPPKEEGSPFVLVSATPSPRVPVTPSPTPSATPTPTHAATVSLVVPFTSQAPTGNWDPLHQDACEEASLVMVEWFRKDQPLTAAVADQELQDLVHYEESIGYEPSITLEQLMRVAKDKYGLTTGRIETKVTRDTLRTELEAGRPIIIPAAGQELGNPNFTPPGPVYHMLVVIGYDAATDMFTTNDPGTRNGKSYQYAADVLISAIHDYDAGEDIENGTPAYLVFD